MGFVKIKLANKEILVIAFISLVGFFVRLAFLTTDRFLTYDEAWTLAMAKAEISGIINGSISAINLPLHFLLLHFWLKINQSLFFLRFSSALLGTFTIVLMWFVAKKLFSPKAGQIASLLVAFSPAFIFESINLRMYALGILESLLIIYFFWQFLKSQKNFFLFALGLAILLGLYTHQFFLLAVLALDIFFFFNFHQYRRLLTKWLGMHLIVFLLSFPILWLSLTLPSLKLLPYSFSFWKIPSVFVVFTFSWDAIQILNLFPFKPTHPLNPWALFVSASLFLTFLFGLKSLKDSQGLFKFFLFYIFLPIISVSFVSIFFRPIFGVRSFVIFSPAYYLVTAYGLAKLKQKNLIFVMTTFLLMLGLILTHEYLGFKKTRSALQPYNFVKNHSRPQDIFIHSDPYTLVLAKAYLDDNQLAISPSWFSAITESSLGYDLISPEEISSKGNRFWYFLLENQYYNRDFVNQKQREFEEKYQIIISKRFENDELKITLFDSGKK